MYPEINSKKNINGFGLTEVLVAMGLVAIISYGLVTMLSNAGKSQRSIQAKDMQREVMAEISSHLSDNVACINSFGGSNPAVPFTKMAINDSLGAAKYAVGANHNSNLVQYSEFKIEDWVADAALPTQGRANLTVRLTKLGDIIGVREIQQKIGLRIKLDGANNIIDCFSIGSNSEGFWKASAFNVNDIYFSGGNVGIGTTNPVATLDVAGSVRPGSEVQVPVCNAAREGTQRYNYTTHALEYCGGSPLGWISAGYIRGGVYGGCYQTKDAAWNNTFGGLNAWPITSCPGVGAANPTCAAGFTLVCISSSQGNGATAANTWNFLNMDIYWMSWACVKQ